MSSKSDMAKTPDVIYPEAKFLTSYEPVKPDKVCAFQNTVVG